MALLLGPVATVSAAPAADPPARAQGAVASARSVTLVTGDQVRLAAPGHGTYGEVVPGPGRRGMTFLTHRWHGRVHVVPADAVALITAGRLDRRLFDVTGLLAAGYGAEGRTPLNVRADRAATAATTSTPAHATGTTRVTERVPGRLWASVRPRDRATGSYRGGVSRIELAAPPTPARRPVAPTRRPAAPTKTYTLTITHLDRAGRPTSGFSDLVFGLDADRLEFPQGRGATTKVRLPKGRYHLETTVTSGSETDPDFHTLVRPLVILDRNLSITADARVTRPVSVAAPRRSARLALVDLAYRRQPAPGRILESGILSRRLDDTFTAHQGPAVGPDELVDRISTQWAEPDGAGGFADTPYVYGLFWLERGRYPTGFAGRARAGELATIRSRHVAQPGERSGRQRALRFYAPRSADGIGGWSVGLPVDVPSTLTAHLMAGGVRWSGSMIQTARVDDVLSEETWLSSPWRAYSGGRTYDDRWNAAVLGPGLVGPPSDDRTAASSPADRAAVARYGDRIVARVPMYTDQNGHPGGSRTDTASTTLYRDGVQVGRSAESGAGEFEVPPGSATYRLVTSATRSSVSDLSTRVSASWTFRSGHAAPAGELLPVTVVRFAPQVDAHNRSAGGTLLLPLRVEAPNGAGLDQSGTRVRTVAVRASYDDGHTWVRARMVRRGTDRWVAVLSVPSGGAYVSLRARVVDLSGNTSEQTITRAYALR